MRLGLIEVLNLVLGNLSFTEPNLIILFNFHFKFGKTPPSLFTPSLLQFLLLLLTLQTLQICLLLHSLLATTVVFP